MRIEDVPLYAPCQPHWLCVPFMGIFALLLLIGLVFFYSHYLSRILKNSARTKSAPIAAHSLSRSSGRWSSDQYQINLKRENLIGFDIFALTLNSQRVFLIQSVV